MAGFLICASFFLPYFFFNQGIFLLKRFFFLLINIFRYIKNKTNLFLFIYIYDFQNTIKSKLKMIFYIYPKKIFE